MAKPIIATILARLDVLEQKVLGHVRRRVSRNEMARLRGVTPRTIARWVESGRLEPPDVVNNRLYFWADESERGERGAPDTAEARAARNPKLRKPALTSPGT